MNVKEPTVEKFSVNKAQQDNVIYLVELLNFLVMNDPASEEGTTKD